MCFIFRNWVVFVMLLLLSWLFLNCWVVVVWKGSLFMCNGLLIVGCCIIYWFLVIFGSFCCSVIFIFWNG